jgi:peptidoglycan/xylan/chitin deacetylase (PgdA/CDA1 family)
MEMKYFVLSFDDGTVHDRRFVELLNKYQIPCTFNLNSGLEDFVWQFEGHDVVRQCLKDTVTQYQGHEIASHTLHHPRLDLLPPPELRREVEGDCLALKRIFGVQSIGFGVPFTCCNEREIRIIRKFVRYIRLSEYSDSFELPKDPYHIPIHALYNDADVRAKIAAFAESALEDGLFIMAGHSYELEFRNHWVYMEELLKYIKSFGFKIVTTMEFVNHCYS